MIASYHFITGENGPAGGTVLLNGLGIELEASFRAAPTGSGAPHRAGNQRSPGALGAAPQTRSDNGESSARAWRDVEKRRDV